MTPDLSAAVAVTLHQPFATLAVSGVKGWETRPYAPHGDWPGFEGVRRLPGCVVEPGGWVLIHAGSRVFHHGRFFMVARRILMAGLITAEDEDEYRYGQQELDFGAVVGAARVVEVRPIVEDGLLHDGLPRFIVTDGRLYVTRRRGPAADVSDQLPFGDWAPGRVAWRLADAHRLSRPVPAKGRQGVWRPSPALIEEVHRGW